jgi:hypothetical protein
MAQISEAYALLSSALENVRKAHKLMQDEWKWHRPDCNWKLPADYDAHATVAQRSVQAFLSDVYWVQNSLRRHGKPADELNAKVSHTDGKRLYEQHRHTENH